MPHSFISNLHHVVFSTKQRQPWIRPELQEAMRGYIGGIARKNGMVALAVGGIADHMHVLLALPPTMPVAKAVQLIKAGSSKWFREKHQPQFFWQEGYASFSVSKSNQQQVTNYIHNQEQHHRKRDFIGELRQLLRLHEIVFDDSM